MNGTDYGEIDRLFINYIMEYRKSKNIILKKNNYIFLFWEVFNILYINWINIIYINIYLLYMLFIYIEIIYLKN